MKRLLLFAMIAFGMSATAQTVTPKDSLATCEYFQSRIKDAGYKVAKEVLADPAKESQHGYARYIRKEPTGRYWIEQLSHGVVYDFPATDGNCHQDSIVNRVRLIFGHYAEISGL